MMCLHDGEWEALPEHPDDFARGRRHVRCDGCGKVAAISYDEMAKIEADRPRIRLPVTPSAVRHFITYVPIRRSLLGGGDPGYVSCSCGWSHMATSAHNAHRLHALHIEGKL